jgi:iron-sulfur cluster assembly protein
MAITVTENAAKQIRSQLAKRGKGVGLRVGVKKVGCSGFAYTFDYADEMHAGDQSFEAHNAKIVVDAETLSLLEGSRLDFVKEGFKQVFKFDNPNIDSTCGCGESFSVKESGLAARNANARK